MFPLKCIKSVYVCVSPRPSERHCTAQPVRSVLSDRLIDVWPNQPA